MKMSAVTAYGFQPVLLLGTGADEPVEAALRGREPARHAERPRVDAGHVDAERVRERGQDDQVERDLGDAVAGHSLSPRKSTYRR